MTLCHPPPTYPIGRILSSHRLKNHIIIIYIIIIIDYENNDLAMIKYNHLRYNIIIIPCPLIRPMPTTHVDFFLVKFYGHNDTYTFLTRFVLFDCYIIRILE